jgi:lipopolysaccharide transport system ATP-binding protein
VSTCILAARQLGKYYRHYPSVRARLWEVLSGRPCHRAHWVFRGLDFEVCAGEAVGIIGRNGAGKSTLLRVLSGSQHPNEGRVERHGRVAAILDLGIGLHPDFSGRDNARQMALAQGVAADRLPALLPQIEAFAELGDYFDEPVHTYSSGMQMRLGFSVATAMRPDVLIVDEALAVGDARFQHKCYEHLRRLREDGTAVLLVSHDPTSVRSLCTRALLLHDGVLADAGPPSQVLETYNLLLADTAIGDTEQGEGRRGGSGEVRIVAVELTQSGRSTRSPVSGLPVVLTVTLEPLQTVPDLTLGILIRDRLGHDMFGTNTSHHGLALHARAGAPLQVEWALQGFHLGPGHYSLTVAVHRGVTHQSGNFDWWDRCLTFQVLPGRGATAIGPCALDASVRSLAPQQA